MKLAITIIKYCAKRGKETTSDMDLLEETLAEKEKEEKYLELMSDLCDRYILTNLWCMNIS